MRTTTLLPCLALLLAAGCPQSPSAPPPPPPPAAPAAPAKRVELTDAELPVKCGCKLEVKKCSEWAEVDGRWVQMTGNHGLGNMPFCGKEGLRAKVTGHVQEDGKLHVTKVTVMN